MLVTLFGTVYAPVLAAKAAFRSGAGLVQVLIPRELYHIVQTGIPEATCVDRDTKKDFSAYDAVAMGPGLGQSESSVELVKRVLEEYEGALVLDADALNIISKLGCFDALRKRAAEYPTVITPHFGEAIRLLMAETGRKTENGTEDENKSAGSHTGKTEFDIEFDREAYCDRRRWSCSKLCNFNGSA